MALARGDEVIAAERQPMRYGHTEALMPMVAAVAGSVAASAIEIVAASVGPGGFTGIRVGLAAAQGIALAAGARAVGVTGFAAVAALLAEEDPRLAEEDPRPVLVVIDSRRSELYVQLMAASGAPLAPAAPVLPSDLPAYVAALVAASPLRVAGDAAAAAADALRGHGGLDLVAGSAPDALGVLAALRPVWREGVAAQPMAPLYLRPPNASVAKNRSASVAGPLAQSSGSTRGR